MDKLDLFILGMGRFARENGIYADYKGLPFDDDFEWLGDVQLPPDDEVIKLGELELADIEAKRKAQAE